MMRLPLLLLVVALFSTGCSAVRGIDSPTVEVLDARVVEESAQGARVELTLRVTNPNVEELPMPRVTCDLDVVGAGRFTFTDVPQATVPGRGSQVITVPTGVSGSGLRGRQFTARGTVVFSPSGQLRQVMTDMGVPLPRSGFTGEGVVLGARPVFEPGE